MKDSNWLGVGLLIFSLSIFAFDWLGKNNVVKDRNEDKEGQPHDISEIHLKDGTRCIILNDFRVFGISCDWNASKTP